MAKAGGTYPNIVQGVSEKQPQHRRPGQMAEQVNMLSDPVRGLVRRRGSRYVSRIGIDGEGLWELQDTDVFDFTFDGVEYALIYRKGAASADVPLAYLYCKSTYEFLPITYENSTWVNQLRAGGVSALAAAGRYLYIAGHNNRPVVEQENLWDTPENLQKLAVWFRTGKYSTTYKVSLIRDDGTRLTREYTTKPAAYPEVLDTSDIEFWADPPNNTQPRDDYQKDVNDRVNEYNGLVNAWIKEAAEDIVPQNIAEKIAEQFAIDGVFVTTTENGGLLVDDEEFVDIEVDDGGDNTTAYAVGREITDATRVSRYHFHGKIVRVRPRGAGSDEAYYLEARLDDGRDDGFGAVSWFEVAGVSATITRLFAQLIVHDGQAYVAQDAAGLETLAPTSGPHVQYAGRVVGDGLTSPVPWFAGKPITMLGMFQDRLLVGSENYVNASRTGDYLNFFRGSVLSIVDEDPVEVFAHGSEGDVLRYAVPYNGNLIIFGEQQQYGISGENVFSPKSPLIRPISSNKDAALARPVSSGNFIFYTQAGVAGTSLHQMRVGALNGQATVTDELSDDLGDWLFGRPEQIAAMTAPNVVMFRTHVRNEFYLYQYLDDKNNGQRVQAAWSKFRYAEPLGSIIGVTSYNKEAIIFTRRGEHIFADAVSLDADIHEEPLLDSRTVASERSLLNVADEDGRVVGPAGHWSRFLGTTMDKLADFMGHTGLDEDSLQFGVVSPAFVTPTNPFSRDGNGQAVLDGRLVLNRVGVDVEATGGMVADVATQSGVVRTTDFEGRILGSNSNIIGEQSIYTGQLNISVGREVRDCTYTIRSKDWLPLRITGLSWVGQVFNHVQRVS